MTSTCDGPPAAHSPQCRRQRQMACDRSNSDAHQPSCHSDHQGDGPKSLRTSLTGSWLESGPGCAVCGQADGAVIGPRVTSLPRARAVRRELLWLHKRPHGRGDGLTRLHDARSVNRRRPCRARRLVVERCGGRRRSVACSG
jgi:hypothetical protein